MTQTNPRKELGQEMKKMTIDIQLEVVSKLSPLLTCNAIAIFIKQDDHLDVEIISENYIKVCPIHTKS